MCPGLNAPAVCPAIDERGVTRPVACTVGAFQTSTAETSITISAPASATLDTRVSYTLTITNNGPAPATGVTVTDTLPQARASAAPAPRKAQSHTGLKGAALAVAPNAAKRNAAVRTMMGARERTRNGRMEPCMSGSEQNLSRLPGCDEPVNHMTRNAPRSPACFSVQQPWS